MDVTRRTTTSTSSGLPQDPMRTDPNVHVPPTTEGPTNMTNTVNPTNPDDLANLANTTNPVDPANPLNLNNQPLPPRIDPSTTPQTQEDIELSRLREAVGQVTQIEEPCVVGCDAFAQQRREFLRWMDDQAAILQAHLAKLNHRNMEVGDLIRQFNKRTTERGHDIIRDHLQGRLINSSGRVYEHLDNGQTVQPGPSSTRIDLLLPEDGQILPNRPYGKNSQFLASGGLGGQTNNSREETLPPDQTLAG
uniref:Uncharacterized protein n=1 Tax=Cannabis sativa TaxID=3483 RepID=A0A803P5Z8_CANSA